ncbi:type I polyketide synthase [Haliangium ochraceum]|uniref:6-deoxyerythronolide-B synthase n=1 Tax=Haliangium ochraceum (strain DSM 14365 / JCM 11303 / SMP-2) TaxID=502025 RepID=D0LQX2_HALO1|nr:type I polyketide synthase [Haliangium ochraceum]ACY15480.1 6-deoxyerythronolide-B synthase [Haliangium ochraceum DSM 14365]
MSATKSANPSPLQQAFHVIRDLESRVFALTAEPIAILGMGCRFPGAVTSPEGFWRLLAGGQDATSEVPAERFDIDAFYDPDPAAAGKTYTRRAGMLDSIDGFDARFFGISPREAVLMDPQQRLLLETTWEALERAGLPPHALEKSATGVFVGAAQSDYLRRHAYADTPKDIDVYDGTGNATCFSAGRISYLLGLQGPSFTVDTACSSSLLAVHLACQSLRAGESEVAIAAGVNLIISPETFVFLSRAGNISPDGRSKAFSATADGYGRGEGCGVLVLKRLSRARADGDPILAVLRGSAVNHDGPASGLTVPSGLAQQAVIRQACGNAGIAAERLDYVEAHGTATLLGDPVELDALGALMAGRSAERPLWVGSVKSNIGHLETAAGVAGLMKVVLMMQHRQIPPSLHFTAPNPHVDWERLPLRVPTALTEWQADEPRRAGVSSFGLSGTNVHVVVEEVAAPAAEAAEAETAEAADAAGAPEPGAPEPGAPEPGVLLLSARTAPALRALVASWRERLADPALRASAPAIARAAALRRSHLEHRLAVVGEGRAAWLAALDAYAAGEDGEAPPPGLLLGRAEPGRATRLAFVFSGQGSQWPGMGRELFARSAVFRASVSATAAALAAHGGYPVLEAFAADAPPPDLERGDVVQPLLFTMHVALAAQWRAWGVEPEAVTGHSVGEIAAAHVAGALTLDDAARLVTVRSELMMRISHQGAMAVLGLPADDAATWVARTPEQLSIAAVNAPGSTVVSGQPEAVDALLAALAEAGVFARRVKIDVASHSPQVEPLLAEYRQRLAGLRPVDGALPFLSTVTGAALPGSALDAAYWARNLRQPVRFADAVAALERAGFDRFLEVGPHPVLTVAMAKTLAAGAVVTGSLRRGRPALEALGEALATLHVSGHPVPWETILRAPQPPVSLPTYPWQHERYWESVRSAGAMAVEAAGDAATLAGRRVLSPGQELHFVDRLQLAERPYLDEHRIFDAVVVPGAFHLAALLSVARELVGDERIAFEELSFPQALVVAPAEPPRVHLSALPGEDGRVRIRRASPAPGARAGGAWVDHVTGFARALEGAAGERPAWAADADADTDAGLEARTPADFYERNTRRGIELGPSFRWMRALWVGPGRARATLARPEVLAGGSAEGRAPLHPAQLDAVFQTFAAAVPEGADDAYIPFSIERLAFYGEPGDRPLRCEARYQPGDDDAFLIGDAVVFDGQRVVARVDGLRLRRVSRAALSASGRPVWSEWLFETRWDRQAPSPAPPASGDGDRAGDGGRWLLLAGERGVAERLADALRARGRECAIAHPGAAFARHGDDAFTLDPSRREHLEQLVSALGEGAPLRQVVYLGGIADAAPVDAPLTWPAARAERVVAGLLHLAQALAAAALRDPPRLRIVTRGAQRASDEGGAPDLAAAQLWGMARSLYHEHPELGFARIDLDPARPADGDDGDEMAALLAELLADAREDEVALRAGQRRVARIVRAARSAAAEAAPVRGDGSYLITGGLGGLGLRLAAWLAERGAAHIVLVGRRGVSDDQQRQALAQLRERGVTVEVVAADVGEPAELARALERAQQLAPLRGVVHAAGAVDDALLAQQDPARYRRVLVPKALGALHLHQLTAGAQLDFFVLFSSAAALIGAPGQSNYAAANSVLDALAQARRARGLPALAVAWGAFAEVGMAAAQDVRGARLAERGILGMRPEDGFDTLGHLLARGVAQAAVLALDTRQWLESSPALARAPRFSELVREGQQSGAGRSALRDLAALRAAPADERRARVERLLRQEIGRVLRIDGEQLEPQAQLGTLGFDSLLSLELRNRLESLLGLSLSAVLLWTYPTLESLTEHLSEQLAPAPPDAARPAAEPATDSAEAASDAAGDAQDDLSGDSAEDDLENLSDEERAQLEERLAALTRRL